MRTSEFIKTYLSETSTIAGQLDCRILEKVLEILLKVKNQGARIFFLGVGGGAGTGAHAANDFNKIAEISTLCLTDNVGVLTALANDEGWESIFMRQLEMHKLNPNDCLFIYSVGGGSENISNNLVSAINHAKKIGARIVGVVGSETGVTAKEADACIVVPVINADRKTAHTEDFQLVVNHLLANIIFQISKGNIEND